MKETLYPKTTLNIKETAEYTGICEDKIRRLVHTLDFPYFNNGCKFLINRALLDEWLKKISLEHRRL